MLVYLLASRYCDSDNLSDFAWSQFGGIGGGAKLVQAICDFVHGRIRFDYARGEPAPHGVRRACARALASAGTSPISPRRCAGR